MGKASKENDDDVISMLSEFTVENASLEKLAKMLKVLSFMAQTKVHLLWKNPALCLPSSIIKIAN
jgi:hypothetical protein